MYFVKCGVCLPRPRYREGRQGPFLHSVVGTPVKSAPLGRRAKSSKGSWDPCFHHKEKNGSLCNIEVLNLHAKCCGVRSLIRKREVYESSCKHGTADERCTGTIILFLQSGLQRCVRIPNASSGTLTYSGVCLAQSNWKTTATRCENLALTVFKNT